MSLAIQEFKSALRKELAEHEHDRSVKNGQTKHEAIGDQNYNAGVVKGIRFSIEVLDQLYQKYSNQEEGLIDE